MASSAKAARATDEVVTAGPAVVLEESLERASHGFTGEVGEPGGDRQSRGPVPGLRDAS